MIGMAWLAAKAVLGGLSSRAWLMAGAVIAFGIWTWQVYGAGYEKADGLWRSKALEAKIARLEREISVHREADAAEDRMRAELEQENQRQKTVIDDYLAELGARADKCLLGPDASRLQ